MTEVILFYYLSMSANGLPITATRQPQLDFKKSGDSDLYTGFDANFQSESSMKVYLDDERLTTEGWDRVYWPDEAIRLLETGVVKEISLDHDLGNDARGNGYDLILWMKRPLHCAASNRQKSSSTPRILQQPKKCWRACSSSNN